MENVIVEIINLSQQFNNTIYGSKQNFAKIKRREEKEKRRRGTTFNSSLIFSNNKIKKES